MDKRTFLKISGIAGAGVLVAPWIGCGNGQSPEATPSVWGDAPFALPELGFALDALAPAIDAETMGLHHGKHHAGYVRKLNAALAGTAVVGDGSLEGLLRQVGPEEDAVRNNGGGHFNHSLYWEVLQPGGGNAPAARTQELIDRDFGSTEAMIQALSSAASKQFGSGWAWLSLTDEGSLVVSGTPNQDNPLMARCVEQTGTPILGIDVWEHAYYLNYQNRRGDYVQAFTTLINWDAVEARLLMAVKSMVARIKAGA